MVKVLIGSHRMQVFSEVLTLPPGARKAVLINPPDYSHNTGGEFVHILYS